MLFGVRSSVTMLRIPIKVKHRHLPSAGGRGSGPQGRINKMRELVTALIRHERIEGQHQWVDEARGYAERVSRKSVVSSALIIHKFAIKQFTVVANGVISHVNIYKIMTGVRRCRPQYMSAAKQLTCCFIHCKNCFGHTVSII